MPIPRLGSEGTAAGVACAGASAFVGSGPSAGAVVPGATDVADSDVGTVMATSTGVDVAESDTGTVIAISTGVAVSGEGSDTTPLSEQIARGRGRFAGRVVRGGFTCAIVVSSLEDMCVRALLDWLRISKQERQEAGRRVGAG